MHENEILPQPGEITALLSLWSKGDQQALNNLIPLVYKELRKTAHYLIGNFKHRDVIQPTMIIHEVYIRLSDNVQLEFPTRSHFFSFAGKMIRNILVDHVRTQLSMKKGGDQTIVSLDKANAICGSHQLEPITLISLDTALTELATFDLRQSRLVELRFFAGLSIQELGEQFNISVATVHRELKMARHWLARKLESLSPKEAT